MAPNGFSVKVGKSVRFAPFHLLLPFPIPFLYSKMFRLLLLPPSGLLLLLLHLLHISSHSISHGHQLCPLSALVSSPTVSFTPDGSLQLQWRSQGQGRGVFGYRVLYRAPNGGWNPFGQLVPYVGDDEEYSLALTGLSMGVPYELQIQALDRNSYVLFTSPEIRSAANCVAPTQPPAQLAVDAPDPRHVRVTWVPLAPSAWKCAQAQVELQASFRFFGERGV
jgi:hypothetical protein